MSAQYRAYHFPPLDLLRSDRQPPAASAAPAPAPARLDPKVLAQAYEQAAQRGYAQGFSQGQVEGSDAGQAAGYEAGFAQGRAKALADAQATFAQLALPVDALKQKLELLRLDWEASLRKDLIELVEKVSRQVVRCELTLQPAQILSLVEETLSGMPQRTGDVHVFLNPADLQRIQELDVSRAQGWQLQPDSGLDAGECRLLVGAEEIDAGCKQRLAACMEQVREQLQTSETA